MVEQGGQKQILAAPGANHHLSVSDILLATEAISTTKVLLAPLEVPLPVLVAAMRLAREANAQIVLDAGPPTSLDDDLLHMVDVLRANAGEAEKLTGIQVRNRKSARQAGDNLRGRGVGATIIEAGEEGNLLVWSQGERLLPLLEVDSVDTTGAGDAFAGALAVALAEGQSLVQAAEFANVAAALATTKIGAQAALPRRDEIAAFLESET
jgi:ribokinase